MQETLISPANLEKCLKCSICVDVCPMMKVNPQYPGPKQAGPDGERYRLKDPEFFDSALKYCLNCKRCEVACPSGVEIGDIIQLNRLQYYKSKHALRDKMLASTDFVGSLASPFAPVVNPVLGWGLTKGVLDGMFGVSRHRTFPKYSSKKFEKAYRKLAAQQDSYPRYVSYFHGCYVNYNYPQLGMDLITIMNACGYGVKLLEKEKCCGVALISNGYAKQATKQANVNLTSIRNAHSVVLTTSSTCTFTIRDEYEKVLGLDVKDVRPNIVLATKWLFDMIENGSLKLAFREDYHKKVAYHTACHIQKMGWQHYSIALLRSIPGVELSVPEQHCCGISGTFGFKKENYEFSQKIGSELFDALNECTPDIVATDCETCKWQIEGSTSYEVLNPVSIIAQALDIEKTKQLNGIE